MNSDDNLQDSLRTVAINTCETWDIGIHDVDDIQLTQTDDDTYTAEIPVSGRVLFEDLLDDQGTLLYMKDDVEVQLKGMLDDRLLLELILH